MTQLAPKQPIQPPEPARVDHIHLSSVETTNLLELLLNSEEDLHDKAEAEQADKRRHRCYST